MDAYLNNLALRLQQKLRNDLGHTYSIYASESGRQKATLCYIYFDGLHDEFETNILAVRDAITNDLKHLSNATIDEALREYKKYGYELKTGHYILVGRGFSPPMPSTCSKGGLKPRPTVFNMSHVKMITKINLLFQ